MKILFLDIETAPNKVYSWGLWNQTIGINQIVEPGFTLCWAAKWHGKPEVFFSGLNEDSRVDMLQQIWNLLDEADVVVHYNGNKFDIPTLNAEFVQLGLAPPTPSHHIDLYRIVRQRFKFPSNKLDYVVQALDLGAKHEHKGMPLWTGCMEGDPQSWKTMKRYNIQDVRLLPRLYKKVLPWIKSHPNHALYMDTDRPVCTNCGSHRVQKCGVEHTKTLSYQRYRCSSCGTPLRGRSTILSQEKRKNILTGSKL